MMTEVYSCRVSPSGQIMLSSGLLNTIKSDDELATVLSHEIAHIVARHPAQSISAQTITCAVVAPFIPPCLSFALLATLIEEAIIFAGVFGIPIALGALLGLSLSRDRESEADYIGLWLMTEAGFNPFVAANLWSELDGAEKRQTAELIARIHKENPKAKVEEIPQIMRTHPLVSPPYFTLHIW